MVLCEYLIYSCLGSICGIKWSKGKNLTVILAVITGKMKWWVTWLKSMCGYGKALKELWNVFQKCYWLQKMLSWILWKQKGRAWKVKKGTPLWGLRKGQQLDKFEEHPCPPHYMRLFCLFVCLFSLGKLRKEGDGYNHNLLFIF